jgi:hypothetical protein
MRDAGPAYQLALRYQLGGNTQYADAAVAILKRLGRQTARASYAATGYANNIP